jgi:hypothetical protein
VHDEMFIDQVEDFTVEDFPTWCKIYSMERIALEGPLAAAARVVSTGLTDE